MLTRADLALLLALSSGLLLAGCGDSTGVSTRVQSVEVSPGTVTVRVPATVQLVAIARDAAATPVEGRPVRWFTDDPAVAIVSQSGLVVGRASGHARVVARIDGVDGSTNITVELPASHVTIGPTSDTVVVYESTAFTVVVTDANGVPISKPRITWSTDNPALAIVEAPGVIRTLQPGTVLVRAEVDGIAGTATLRIKRPPLSVTILSGDGQTDTAGAVLSTHVIIEVRDESGAPIQGVPLWAGELYVDQQAVNDYPIGSTDAGGRAEHVWRPGLEARVHQLQAAVYREGEGGGRYPLAADTISALVTAASPYIVDFVPWDGLTAFLNTTLDLMGVMGPVWDLYHNSVVVRSVAVEAAPPLRVRGTTVVSSAETDAAPNIIVNGVALAYPVRYRRDLRTLAGATGGWVCESPNGSPTSDPSVVVRRRDAAVVVDSVHLRSDGEVYTFYITANYHDQRSDGSVSDFTEQLVKPSLGQVPGAFAFEYGPSMQQTSSSPLRYDADTDIMECGSWISNGGGPNSHQPFWLIR